MTPIPRYTNTTINSILNILHNPDISIIQLITIESYFTISTILNIPFHFISTLETIQISQPIILLIDDTTAAKQNLSINNLSNKIILYSRNLTTEYFKIILKFEMNDKLALLGSKYQNTPKPLLKENKISDLQKENKLNYKYGSCYEEFVILVVVLNNRVFKRICAESAKIDECFTNRTKVMMYLNGLVGKGFIMKVGNGYKISIDKENLKIICKYYDHVL